MSKKKPAAKKAAPTTPAPSVDDQKSVAEQMGEKDEQILRLRADAENLRKRADEQMDNMRKYAVEHFAQGVCEIRDCLEAAMQSNPENAQALQQGVALTLRKLDSVMDAHGIQPVAPDIGAQFDPAIHQAIAKSPDADAPQNTVAAVVRKGYTIHQRTLRPADVVVSAPPADKSAAKSGGKKSKSEKPA